MYLHLHKHVKYCENSTLTNRLFSAITQVMCMTIDGVNNRSSQQIFNRFQNALKHTLIT